MRAGLWIALAALGLTLAACATVEPEDAVDTPMPYACSGGKSFTASYRLNGRVARVTAGGQTLTLREARSGPGARYAYKDILLSTKGAAATLDGAPGGPYRNCRTG